MNRQEEMDRESTRLVCCLEEQIYMELPRGWVRLSDEEAAGKFPYRKRPQEVYAAPGADRVITLNLLEKSLQEKQVHPAIWEMQRMISHLYPESIRETARLIRSREGMAGYFLFVTGGIDHDTCHAMFLLPIHEKMMMGGFHFPAGQMEEGSEIFQGILQSIGTGRDTGEVSEQNGQNGIRGQDHTGAQDKI